MRGGVDGAMLGETRGGVPEDHIAHDLIEKLMVAANEAVANWMHERNISAVYRCHEAPSDEALDELEELVASYGVYSRLPRPVDPLAFAGFCKQIEMNRNMETLWDAVGRVLERAEYTVANDGHFGLGSERYLHFTSPLRRYADLTVHRQVKQYLNGNRTTLERNETLSPIAKHATITSSKSSKAERDARNIQNVMNFAEAAQTQGSVLDAHIVSVKSGSIKVRIGGDQPVMATIAAKNLPKGYTLDESRKELRKGDQTWRRGDSLHVSVENIPLFGGSIEVQISSRQSRGVEKTSRRRGR
jgi:ribonuclease R